MSGCGGLCGEGDSPLCGGRGGGGLASIVVMQCTDSALVSERPAFADGLCFLICTMGLILPTHKCLNRHGT